MYKVQSWVGELVASSSFFSSFWLDGWKLRWRHVAHKKSGLCTVNCSLLRTWDEDAILWGAGGSTERNATLRTHPSWSVKWLSRRGAQHNVLDATT